jgi:hypothetical protein
MEPVAATHHGLIMEVILSKQDYDEYVRLKGLATRAVWAWELDADTLTAIADARVDPRHKHLDALLDE